MIEPLARSPRRARASCSAAPCRLTPWLASFAIGLRVALPFIGALALRAAGAGAVLSELRSLDFGILILIYVMLGWGLNIVVGLAGLLDLGYVAFYAVGAYTYALLANDTSACRSGCCCRSPACLAAFWGVLLGFPVLRLRGDYLAIVTLAFGEIIRLVLINWVTVDQRHAGITSIPRPTLLRHSVQRRCEGGFAATFGLEFISDSIASCSSTT